MLLTDAAKEMRACNEVAKVIDVMEAAGISGRVARLRPFALIKD